MTGILQDKLYIEKLNEAISLSEKTETGKYAPFFSLPNIKGEKITRSSEDFKKKNLLTTSGPSGQIVSPIIKATAS